MRRMIPILLALICGLWTSSCGLVLVKNPKRSGLDCTKSRALPVFDILVAAAGTVFAVQQGVAGDEPLVMVAPATLLATGLWGNVKVNRCRGIWEQATPEQVAQYRTAMAGRRRRQAELDAAALAEETRQRKVAAAAAAAMAAEQAKPPVDYGWSTYPPSRTPDAPASGGRPAPSPPTRAPSQSQPATSPPPAASPPPTVTVTRFSPYGDKCNPMGAATCGFGSCQSIDDVDPSNHGICVQNCNSDSDCGNSAGVKLRCQKTTLTNRQGRSVQWSLCR